MNYGYIKSEKEEWANNSTSLFEAGCERIYIDKQGQESVQLEALLSSLEPADLLIVNNLYCLGNSLNLILNRVLGLLEKKIEFRSLAEHIDTRNEFSRKMFLALCNQELNYTPQILLSRRVAKELKSRPMSGRPRHLNPEKIAEAKQLFVEQKYSVDEICGKLNISRASLYRYLKDN